MSSLFFVILSLIVLSLSPSQARDVEWRKSAVPNRDADYILRDKVVSINPPDANPHIVNGDEARRNSVPYQGALFIPVETGTSFCGCSLINRRTVLTAAHCVDRNTANITIIFGAHNVREEEETQQEFSSGTIILHPGWTRSTLENDVAIIHLSEPVVINEYVRPINLPRNTDHDYVGNQTYVTGWGRPGDSATQISPVLREVSAPVISNLACRLAYNRGTVFPSTICTSGGYGRGTCNGDSGGPLTLNGVLIGVCSFVSRNGCESGWPPGFARVTFFLDWIVANMLLD